MHASLLAHSQSSSTFTRAKTARVTCTSVHAVFISLSPKEMKHEARS